MILQFLLTQGELLAYGGNDESDMQQIEFNMKLTAVFSQCAINLVQERNMNNKYSSAGALTLVPSYGSSSQKGEPLELAFSSSDVQSIISFGRLLKNQS